MTNSTPAPPAGWYPDHTGQPQKRWWDGAAWTEHVQSTPETPYTLAGAPATVPPETPVYNVSIWLVTLLPILSLIALLSTDMTGMMQGYRDPFAIYSNPGYLATLASGVVVYASSILLAYSDRNRLVRDGFDRPFHWAWAFLGGSVYVVGRSIIVRRRSGRGFAPFWVWLVLFVASSVISTAKISIGMAALLHNLPDIGVITR